MSAARPKTWAGTDAVADFRSCLICQTFIFRQDLLCRYCWRRWNESIRRTGLTLRTSPFLIQSLWAWDRPTDEISRALIYGLKGQTDPRIWQPLANLMVHLSSPMPRQTCLVPIPSKRGLAEDHATGLARAIGRLTGWPVEDCLEAPQQISQRGLTRRQRQKIQIRMARKPSRPYAAYILVDDVVTSGATLEAAYKALRRPLAIQGWCLMDRALVAD